VCVRALSGSISLRFCHADRLETAHAASAKSQTGDYRRDQRPRSESERPVQNRAYKRDLIGG
jgi:hypothetical protein